MRPEDYGRQVESEAHVLRVVLLFVFAVLVIVAGSHGINQVIAWLAPGLEN